MAGRSEQRRQSMLAPATFRRASPAAIESRSSRPLWQATGSSIIAASGKAAAIAEKG